MTDDAAKAFIHALAETVADGRFVKLRLKDYHGAEADLLHIDIRKILVKLGEKLSFTYHYRTRDIVKNYTLDDACARTGALLKDFRYATLYTRQYNLLWQRKNETATLRKTKPSDTAQADLNHDRRKQYIFSSKAKPYLHALAITDVHGAIYKNAQDKFRQINKYIEILDSLIRALPAKPSLRIADMGSGKGYLTFALYDHITRMLGRKAELTGVEYRADMVELCNRVARESDFGGLHFTQSAIVDYETSSLDMLIALHACDTATDEAIYKGIKAGAFLIVVAPCCHKQIRREMDKNHISQPLDILTQHGIFMERQAEMVTDGLRALLLEYHGYRTKIFEFISSEHTAKNVMIVATRGNTTQVARDKISHEIDQIKTFFGISHHHLEDLLKQ